MQNEFAKLPPPPRLVTAFTAGFNAIANHVTIIALPVLVDLFLWFGPHLKLDRLLKPMIDLLPTLKMPAGSPGVSDPAAVQKVWTEFANRFNLFIGLRTFPVGPASLMSGQIPVQTPIGVPIVLQPSSLLVVFGWTLLILLAGWTIGSMYFRAVSGVALNLPPRPLVASMLQVVMLSVFWVGVLLVVGFPLLVLLGILNLISPVLAQAGLIIFGMAALWLVLPVFFSPHGIFTGQQNAFSAIRSSLRMIRYTLPTSGLFLMGVVIIGQGLDFLWRTPPDTSWWTLLGIAGHAFISTSLLAASFVYYRDVNAWLADVMEQLKRQQPVTAKV
jgi:hypothetical protein